LWWNVNLPRLQERFYPLLIILVITVVITVIVIIIVITVILIHLLEGIMSTLAITSLHNPRFLISGIIKKPHCRNDEACGFV